MTLDDVEPVDDRVAGSTARRIAWIALNAAVLFVPLAMSNITWLGPNAMSFTVDQFELVQALALTALVAASLLAWALWLVRDEAAQIRRSPVDPLVALFAGWMILSTFFALDRSTSVFGQYMRFEGLLTFLAYVGVYWLALQLTDGFQALRTLLRSVMASTALVSAYALVQYAGLDPLRWGGGNFEADRVFSTLGNPDILGGFLIFGLVIGPALALSEDDQRLGLLWWLCSGLAYAAWIVSFVRIAWLAGAVAVVVLAAYLISRRSSLARVSRLGVAVAAALGLSGILLAVVGRGGYSLTKRLAGLLDTNLGARLDIWGASLAAAWERPVFGWGLDSAAFVLPRFFGPEHVPRVGVEVITDNFHSLALQLAVGIGIPGALAGLAILGFGLYKSLPRLLAQGPSRSALCLMGVWAACLGFSIQALLTVTSPGSGFLLWMGIGLLMATVSRKVLAARSVRVSVLVAAGLFASVSALVVAGSLVGERAALESLTLDAPDARIAAIERANTASPWQDAYKTMRFDTTRQAFLGMSQSAGEQRPSEAALLAAFNAALAASDSAMAANPGDHMLWIDRAALLNDAARWSEAEDAAMRAIVLLPSRPDARLQLALSLAGQGDVPRAQEALREALDMAPTYLEASLYLGDSYIREGRTVEAGQVYAAARRNLQWYEAPELVAALEQAEQALGASQ